MIDVLKFIGLVVAYRRNRVLNPEKAVQIGEKIDKACNEFLQGGFISEKDCKV